MTTKQLDFIASTPVLQRRPIMPRIRCKDGVSLSVQASSRHLAKNKPGSDWSESDAGPWCALEVAYISIAPRIPAEWEQYVVGSLYSTKERHDCTGLDSHWVPRTYCIPLEEIRNFIEVHGGEIEDLHLEVVMLREKVDEKYNELQRAQEKERSIW